MNVNLEEMYTILYGASNSNSSVGVKYDVLKRWFTECGIISVKYISEDLFSRSYSRLCPNRDELSLTQFIQLLGVLARESRHDVRTFEASFQTVKEQILDEIQDRIRNEQNQ